MKACEINIRDPFVLVEAGKYYMYGTRGETAWVNGKGFDVYISNDLHGEWAGPFQVFSSEKYGMDNGANWAPEVHKYKGEYYLFATFKQTNGNLGTYIMHSVSPLGPFVPHSNGAITPNEWKCLDGTLYINKEGKPNLVICHEWTQIQDGTICAVELSDNLQEAISEPLVLFAGSAPSWTNKENKVFITDGPFVYRLKDGTLTLTWSTFLGLDYLVAIAVSDNQELDGRWIHNESFFFAQNGGHGMIFRDLENNLIMTLHSPNDNPLERPKFYTLIENNSDDKENILSIEKTID